MTPAPLFALGLPVALRPATAADVPAIHALLERHALPLDGFHVANAVVAVRPDSTLAGVAALERYDGAALLRSVAVDASGQGVGTVLVAHLLSMAAVEGRTVVLLTTTADGYFPRFGFRTAERADVPVAVTASAEFRGACPASAVVMMRSHAEAILSETHILP